MVPARAQVAGMRRLRKRKREQSDPVAEYSRKSQREFVLAEEAQRGENREMSQRRVGVGSLRERVPYGGGAAELRDVQCDQLVEPKQLCMGERGYSYEVCER